MSFGTHPSIEPPGYFDVPPDRDTCANEDCNNSCDPGIGLCEPCLKDAEHDAKCDLWHDDSAGLWP